MSWAHACLLVGQGIPSPDEAHVLALALHTERSLGVNDWLWLQANLVAVVPNPQVVSLWIGLCLYVFGNLGLYLWSLPFHLAMGHGLWRGGSALGGAPGGAWALLAGFGASGTLAIAGETLLDFPLAACVAFVAGAAAGGHWRTAIWGLAFASLTKLAALPVLAIIAVDVVVQAVRARRNPLWVLPAVALVLALYVPNLDALSAYAGASATGASAGTTPVGQRVAYHLQSAGIVAGPALLGGVIAGLLGRGDVVTLRMFAWALGVLAGLVPLSFFAQVRYALPVVPLLAIAGAGAGRWPLGGLSLVALVQLGGFHLDRAGWPARPAALRPPTGAPFDVDAVLDWLVAHGRPGERAHAALHLAGSERLHFGLFAVRALERDLPLELVVVDDHRPLADPTELGVLITIPGQPTVRQGWRAALPPHTETWSWPEGYVVQLWDRGLPLESLLATPEEAERRNHPREQSLWMYDGTEHGPLLPHASSPAVRVTPAGYELVFVRDQALWFARSVDGLTFDEPRPLTDKDGPILAFDPAFVPNGLLAAELVGSDRMLDPASHPTRIVRWTGTLDALARAETLVEGVGLVDPVFDGATLYLTADRSRVRRATSVDGHYQLDPAWSIEGVTVPEAAPGGLIGQTQVMGWSTLVVESDGRRTPLELCGTGAALVTGRLYYTRADDNCPVVLPDRRAALDALVRP